MDIEQRINKAQWIKPIKDFDGVCPTFFKTVNVDSAVESAVIELTVTGVYELYVNGSRIGNYILAPGWTNYEKRLQYQTYDITDYIQKGENLIEVTICSGWYMSRIKLGKDKRIYTPSPYLIAAISIFEGGKERYIYADSSWNLKQS